MIFYFYVNKKYMTPPNKLLKYISRWGLNWVACWHIKPNLIY